MIEYVEVTNEAGDILHLPLNNFMETGMLITNMEGIGTVRSNISMANYADSDEKKLSSNILEARNITITLRFFNTSTKTVEQIRDECYYYFSPKKTITLTIKTDLRHVSIRGFVESNEPSIFSQEEETQVSLLCEDPLFYDVANADVTVDEYDFNAVRSEFEFPFDNNSLIERLIELGEINHRPINAITYLGEYDTGFTIKLHFKGICINPVIFSNRQDGIFRLLTSKLTNIIPNETQFRKGDLVTINTRSGSKSIVLLRDGKEYNILHILESAAVWPILKTGSNEFIIDAVNGFEFIEVLYEYKTGYLGV